MKILITGGTGFVGSRVIERLGQKGHQFVILTRNPENAQKKFDGQHQFVKWDGRSAIEESALKDIDAAINLVGENIANKRWSEQQKQKIKNSRIEATKALVEGINQHSPQCQVLVSASAIGYYPTNLDSALKEENGPGQGFLPEVCQQWEEQAKKISSNTRLVITRIGVVIGEEGGAVKKLMPIFKMGAGGPVANGKQMMSWIHVDDLAGIIEYALTNQSLSGEFNAVAPQPVDNKTFSKSLARALNRPAIFPAPGFALKLAMGEMSTIVLDSQLVSSEKIQQSGYQFQLPDIDQAMDRVVGKS